MLRLRMDAELAYLFRHALMRDAAYELQTLGDRAKLHELAFHLIEHSFGGRAPAPPPLEEINAPSFVPHSTDTVALDLVHHIELARRAGQEGIVHALKDLKTLYIRRAAEHAESTYRRDTARGLWRTLANELTGVARAAALMRFGRSASSRSDLEQGLHAVDEAVAIAREAGARHFEGMALLYKATLLHISSRTTDAEQTYHMSLEVFREVKDALREGSLLGNLAALYWTTGRVEQARQHYEQALALHRKIGNRRVEGSTLGNLGHVYSGEGNLAEAERLYDQAVAIHRETGDRGSEAIFLESLASTYHHQGRLAQAEKTFQRSLTMLREMGDRRTLGVALGNLACLYAATGRAVEACNLFDEALAVHREVWNRRFEGLHLCDYAPALIQLARNQEARDTWSAGIAILREMGDTAGVVTKTNSMRQACAEAGVPAFE